MTVFTLQQDNNERLDTRDFELGDCLDYIRTGMEAIVDDEVTKRFSAEELTVSNLNIRYVKKEWSNESREWE